MDLLLMVQLQTSRCGWLWYTYLQWGPRRSFFCSTLNHHLLWSSELMTLTLPGGFLADLFHDFLWLGDLDWLGYLGINFSCQAHGGNLQIRAFDNQRESFAQKPRQTGENDLQYHMYETIAIETFLVAFPESVENTNKSCKRQEEAFFRGRKGWQILETEDLSSCRFLAWSWWWEVQRFDPQGVWLRPLKLQNWSHGRS